MPVAVTEPLETFIARADEARVITGMAINTGCRANRLRFFTSGALTPRLGDGLNSSYSSIESRPGERILMRCRGAQAIPTFLMEHDSTSPHR